MPLGDDEVMHHAAIGRLEVLEAPDPPIGADRSKGHLAREGAIGGETEKDEFAGQRVDLGMRGEWAVQPATESSADRGSPASPGRSRSAGVPLRGPTGVPRARPRWYSPHPHRRTRRHGRHGPATRGSPRSGACPAACSACHFAVRTHRFRYEARPFRSVNACSMPSPENQW